MANPERDFDFWQFIACGRCRMPFSLENNAATIPFWLTECGHIICNNHLNSDQSCSQCGSQGIQLAPLQRQMEAPMSEWFQSIPLGLDSIAYAVKFQQQILASQVLYHKSRHQQLRQLLERLKREVTELKNDNDVLRHENDQLQMGHFNDYQNSSDKLNSNGKRQMLPAQQYEYTGRPPTTGSSPRSITTPSGPQRLTLHPGQPLAELSSHKQQEQEQSIPSRGYPVNRPESARSLERYAYTPHENKVHPPQLSYVQNAPRMFQRSKDAAPQLQRQATDIQNLRPPPSARFKPTIASYATLGNQPVQDSNVRRTLMGPPPIPQPVQKEGIGMSDSRRAPNGHMTLRHPMSMSNHQPPPSSSHRPSALPATPISGQSTSGVGPRRFFQPAGPARASNAILPPGGQRTPFVSQRSGQDQQNGFA